MELYNDTSFAASELLTKKYSTSFSMSSRLFSKDIQKYIYAIYGLVRIADEVVDTYRGKDVEKIIVTLEQDTYEAIKRGYSTNPIIHAFAVTAVQFDIGKELIKPFFKSMQMDLSPQLYTSDLYKEYIYGSAEVVGLMCLKVFCGGNVAQYQKLEKGASALGAAYQKVNFLRDIAADYAELGRLYFPNTTFETFDEAAKKRIIKDIEKDFAQAKKAIVSLPDNSRRAVGMSYVYYLELLKKIKKTPAETLKKKRIRVNNVRKVMLMATASTGKRNG
jgi:15-cis-phytoene synthase